MSGPSGSGGGVQAVASAAIIPTARQSRMGRMGRVYFRAPKIRRLGRRLLFVGTGDSSPPSTALRGARNDKEKRAFSSCHSEGAASFPLMDAGRRATEESLRCCHSGAGHFYLGQNATLAGECPHTAASRRAAARCPHLVISATTAGTKNSGRITAQSDADSGTVPKAPCRKGM